jgi:hypothetical protein
LQTSKVKKNMTRILTIVFLVTSCDFINQYNLIIFI